MTQDILIAFDFSPAAEQAVRWAVALHQAIGGRMRVVHVLDPFPLSGAILPYPVPAVTDRDVREVEAQLGQRMADLAPDASVEVLLASETGPAVVASAQAWGATLIVMGTHGRGGLARLVLGSVAQYVVRHAACPVVTMHASAS